MLPPPRKWLPVQNACCIILQNKPEKRYSIFSAIILIVPAFSCSVFLFPDSLSTRQRKTTETKHFELGFLHRRGNSRALGTSHDERDKEHVQMMNERNRSRKKKKKERKETATTSEDRKTYNGPFSYILLTSSEDKWDIKTDVPAKRMPKRHI